MDRAALELAAQARHALIVGHRMEPLLIHGDAALDAAEAVEVDADGAIAVTAAGRRCPVRGVAPSMVGLLRGAPRVVVMRLCDGEPVAAVSVPLRVAAACP